MNTRAASVVRLERPLALGHGQHSSIICGTRRRHWSNVYGISHDPRAVTQHGPATAVRVTVRGYSVRMRNQTAAVGITQPDTPMLTSPNPSETQCGGHHLRYATAHDIEGDRCRPATVCHSRFASGHRRRPSPMTNAVHSAHNFTHPSPARPGNFPWLSTPVDNHVEIRSTLWEEAS